MVEPDFRSLAENLAAQLTAWRRDFHQYPEPGFAEVRTASQVAATLAKYGLEVQTGVAGTGVVGTLRGAPGGRVVGLRADMDALPIEEQTGLPFASLNQGYMHACGHDAHMAILLGVAALLSGVREQLHGQVKFIFQPCEETPPGGARAMLEAGILENPAVDFIVALHVNPHLPAGMIGIKEGTAMAAVDVFQVSIYGRGGHPACPEQGVDAVLVAATAVQQLYTCLHQRVSPLEPVVLNIGTISGGQKNNVVAARVDFAGTVRTLSPLVRGQVPRIIHQVLGGVTAVSGATYELDYEETYPPLVNDHQVLPLVEKAACKVVGARRVLRLQHPSMGSEDFAYLAQAVPAAHFNLGVGRRDGPVYPWHHEKFDLDEAALPAAAAVMAQVAYEYLSGK